MKDCEFFENFDFCCNRLKCNITLETNKSKRQVVMYDPSVRRFSIAVLKDQKAICVIDYCPYCGKKLPKELNEEWVNVILKELGLDYMKSEDTDQFIKELPEEFQTDEWWKKRGL